MKRYILAMMLLGFGAVVARAEVTARTSQGTLSLKYIYPDITLI